MKDPGVEVGVVREYFAHLISSASFHYVIIASAVASGSRWTYTMCRTETTAPTFFFFFFFNWTNGAFVLLNSALAHLPEGWVWWWTDGNYVTEAKALGLEAIWCVNYTDVV